MIQQLGEYLGENRDPVPLEMVADWKDLGQREPCVSSAMPTACALNRAERSTALICGWLSRSSMR